MDNRNKLSYEQMFLEDYNKFIYPDIGAAVDVASNVTNEVVDMINKSGKEYQQYLQNNPMSETIPETLKALGTGIASGAIGIGGDVEMIGTGLLRVLQTKEGQSKLEAFLQGLEQDTVLPTTDDVAKRIKGVVGDTAKGTGFVEGMGEVVAPATVATEGAKKLTQTVKKMKVK